MTLVLKSKKYFIISILFLLAVSLILILLPVSHAYASGGTNGTISSDDIKNQLNQVTGNSSTVSAEQQIKSQGSNIIKYLILISGFIFIGLIIFAGIKLGMAIEEKDRAGTLKWIVAIIAAIIIVASAPFIYNWAINASFK
ncbi:hypothetical protein V7D15_07480 [Thermoanaerobacter thermohydrosulfuricus]